MTNEEGPAPRTCEHCTGKRGRGRGLDNPVLYTGTVGDRIERSLALCEPCYWMVSRSAKSGSYKGQLPTDEQIAWHEDHGTWRIRVA
jgi:hypothetical protein